MKEMRIKLILLLGFYMIINMIVKRVVDIQALLSQIDWRKIAILSLIYESMGHNKRSIYIVSRIYMYGFIDHLLLSLWTIFF
jgi:hypothetical protein